jgi:MFS family permease
MGRNVALYPWFKFVQNLTFWQAIWFLFFQTELSAAEAILLYAIYDVATTAMEVPSGYMSDRLGRRRTLIAASIAGALGAGLIAGGSGFAVFALAQVCLGASAAFASGTDNALLYESLAADGRAEEIEFEETRGWQAALVGLALSAIIGGVLATFGFALAFAAGAVAHIICLVLAWFFAEPVHETVPPEIAGLAGQWGNLKHAMASPVLVWLFLLSVLMYGFSHIPFVFGQPFIAQAMEGVVWPVEAPVVSGGVSAIMMIVSAFASIVAFRLRKRIGLTAILLLAFAIQIGIIATLAATNSALAIAVLFLRMVPNSFARPFIVARIQPLLGDAGRATYLSLQSFAGRLLFAGSLLIVSARVTQGSVLAYADIRLTLAAYAGVGLGFFCLLVVLAGWARVGGEPKG